MDEDGYVYCSHCGAPILVGHEYVENNRPFCNEDCMLKYLLNDRNVIDFLFKLVDGCYD